jgi:predicted GTPase
MDGAPDVLLVELKAAGVDLAAKFALERHMDVVFCDNRVVTVGGDGSFEDFAMRTAHLAEKRYS